MKHLILISGIAIALYACQSAPQSNNATGTVVHNTDSLIVPGASLGQIVLGTDAAPLMALMGRPDSGDAAMGKAISMWVSPGGLTAIYTERNMGVEDTSRIRLARTTYPGFFTKNNIGVGVSLDDIQQGFPVTKLGDYAEGADTFALYTSREGISFEINRENHCTGIIIHPPGSDPTAAYLPFHANLRKAPTNQK